MKRERSLPIAALLAIGILLLGSMPAAQAQPNHAPNQASGWSVFTPGIGITASLNAVAMGAANNDVWAVGDNSTIFHYNGSAWSAVNSTLSTQLSLNSVSPVPGQPGVAWVVGEGQGGINPSTVLVCQAATLSCTRDMNVPTTGQLDGVWAAGPNDVWTVGVQIILHYTGGTNWTIISSPAQGTVPKVQYHNVQMVSATEGWAVGEPIAPGTNGVVLHFTNNTWQDVTSSIPLQYLSPLISLWFISPSEGWLAGGNPNAPGNPPAIVHYLNGVWSQETVPNMAQPTLFWYINMLVGGNGFAVGNGGQVFARSGGTWSQTFVMATGSQQPLYGVWVLPDGSEGWAVGGSTPATGTGVGVLIHYVAGSVTPPPLPIKLYLPSMIR